MYGPRQLAIYDTSEIEPWSSQQPDLKTLYDSRYDIFDAAQSEQGAYVLERSGGFSFIDTSRPTSWAYTIGYNAMPYESGCVAGFGAWLLVDNASAYFELNPGAEVSPGAYMSRIVNFPADESPVCLTQDSLAFFTGRHSLSVADSSNPISLSPLAEIEITLSTPTDMALGGTALFVAGGSGGWITVDVSNPAAPVESQHDSSLASVPDLALANGRLYLAAEAEGMRVMSDGAQPQLIADVPWPSPVKRIVALGTMVVIWASDGEEGSLDLIDMADPESPLVLESIPISGPVLSMELQGNRLHVLTSSRYRAFDVGADGAIKPVDSIRFELDARFLLVGTNGLWLVADQGIYELVETTGCRYPALPVTGGGSQ